MRSSIFFVMILLLYHNTKCQDSNFSIIVEHTSVVIATDYTGNLDGEIIKCSESKIHSGNYDFSLSFKIPICEKLKIDVRPGFLSSSTDYGSNLHLGLYFRFDIIPELFLASGIDAGLIGFGEGAHGSVEPQPGIKPFAVVSIGYNISRKIGLILSAGKQLNEKYVKGEGYNITYNTTGYIRYMKWAFKLGLEYNFTSED